MENFVQSPSIPAPDSLVFKRSPIENTYKIHWDATLGEGSTGFVRKCTALSTGKEYALKLLQDNTESRNEITCWATCLPHPNIVSIRDVFENEIRFPFEHAKRRSLLVVMDLMEGGDLFNEVTKRCKFEEEDAKYIVAQLALAISHMHSKGICHRDIKMENILLENANSLKIRISDFGFATGLRAVSCKHTPAYAAPEVLRSGQFKKLTGQAGLPYNFMCDEWSLGVCVYILLCGYAPFRPRLHTHSLPPDLQAKILRGAFEFPDRDWVLVSCDAKMLIVDLLNVDPAKRLPCPRALQLPWLAPAATRCLGELEASTDTSTDSRVALGAPGSDPNDTPAHEAHSNAAAADHRKLVLDMSSNKLLARRRGSTPKLERTDGPQENQREGAAASGKM